MDDNELLRAIGILFDTVDPPPLLIAQRALDHFDLHHVDAIVAQLVYDSADGLVGVRSTATTREVSYVAGEVTLDLMAERTTGGIRLVGQISPQAEVAIVVVQGDTTLRTRTDELGRFAVNGLDLRPLQLSTDHGLRVDGITATNLP